MDKAVAIIPARGGSKRIPRKNIKDFHGKPLISYSIKAALEAKIFDKVIVTTDDEEIASVAEKYGALAYMRPKELADDYTATQPVIDNVLDYLKSIDEKYDYYCTIYATAPFLQAKYLVEGFEKLKNSDAINAFSATSMPFPIQRTFKIDKNGRCEMFTPEYYAARSQDLEEAYQDAGQFYWSKLNKKSKEIMFGKDSIPIILPRYLVQDIDTLEDWQRAEYMYEVVNKIENVKYLGYEVIVNYGDYDTYKVIIEDLSQLETICQDIETDDKYFNVEYKKKYQYKNKILYTKTEHTQIKNKNIPKKYRLIQNIYDKAQEIYNDANKQDIKSCIIDLQNLLNEVE